MASTANVIEMLRLKNAAADAPPSSENTNTDDRRLESIAREALFAQPVMSKNELEAVRSFFTLGSIQEVTVAHAALLKIAQGAIDDGDLKAFEALANYAGQKVRK